MNKKLIKASVAGAAALALAAGGTTFASWSDYGNINDNEAGAGILKLNLTDGDGSAASSLAFGDLAPGMGNNRAVWVASSDGNSVPKADLFLTISNVRNYENGCSSKTEKDDDTNCASAADSGELSRVLNMRVQSYKAKDALTCQGYVDATDPGPVLHSTVIKNQVGSLADPASLNTQFLISDAANPLEAGDGVCVVFFSFWPGQQDPTHSYDAATLPSDNAAQGDSVEFDTRYDLVQHF